MFMLQVEGTELPACGQPGHHGAAMSAVQFSLQGPLPMAKAVPARIWA